MWNEENVFQCDNSFYEIFVYVNMCVCVYAYICCICMGILICVDPSGGQWLILGCLSSIILPVNCWKDLISH